MLLFLAERNKFVVAVVVAVTVVVIEGRTGGEGGGVSVRLQRSGTRNNFRGLRTEILRLKVRLIVIKDYECVRRRHFNLYTLNEMFH